MQRIKFMYKQFLREPLAFKILISTTLLISIIFSSSAFNGYYQSGAKLAAAIFFIAYGIRMMRNRRVSTIFFILAALCLYLSWENFSLVNGY